MSRKTIRLQPEILETCDLPSCGVAGVALKPPPNHAGHIDIIVADRGHENCGEIIRRGAPWSADSPIRLPGGLNCGELLQMAPRIHAYRAGLQAYPTAANATNLQAYPTAVNQGCGVGLQAFPTAVNQACHVAAVDKVMAEYGNA